MHYTIQQLAALSGVSTRTLRYYHQLDLLCPARRSEAGYRLYGSREADRLQQILFYRELGLSLEEIRCILSDPAFDEVQALRRHRQNLLQDRARLDRLLNTLEQTIRSREENRPMQDNEKFIGFKQKLIEENEARYGPEIRERWGNEAVDTSNRQLMELGPDQYADMQALSEEILQQLDLLFPSHNPTGKEAMELAALHRRWLEYSWPAYTSEAHKNLSVMYMADERFINYYDRGVSGRTAFLCQAIEHYANSLEQ